MNADRAHVAGLQFKLPYVHHAGQSGDHAANALLVHRQQMMFRAAPFFGVFLGDQGLKIRFFAVHGKNHAAEKRQRSLFLRPCDAIFRHKRSSLQKGLSVIHYIIRRQKAMTIFAICPAKIALVSSGQKCYTICPFVDRRRKPLRRRMFAEKQLPPKKAVVFRFPANPCISFFR